MARSTASLLIAMTAVLSSTDVCPAQETASEPPLKVHGIFASNMVIQRGKPINVWGWAKPGETVSVQFGEEKAEATAAAENGRWEATFPPREASSDAENLVVTTRDDRASTMRSSATAAPSSIACL